MRTALAILLFPTLACCLTLAARADGIYKWVDEDGVVHFGAQPPQKEEVEVVKKPKSERLKQWQAQQAALKADGRGIRVDPETVVVTEEGDGWSATVPGPDGAPRRYRGRDAPAPEGLVISLAVRADAAP